MSIEELAMRYYNMWIYGKFNEVTDALRGIATDQDRISRQEERERCIRMAQKVYADLLSAKGYDMGSINSEIQRLRKAMEGGE